MIKNKITLLIILVLITSVFITGCMDKGDGKLENNAAENIVDKDIDANEPTDVAKEDDVEDEEDETDYTVTFDGEEWPTESMDGIPEIPGNITSVFTNSDTRHIQMESVMKKDAEYLVEEVKSLGFTVDLKESNSKTSIIFIGKHEDKRRVTFKWSDDKGQTEIIYNLPFKPN